MYKLFQRWHLLITLSDSMSQKKVITLLESRPSFKWINQALLLRCLILKPKQMCSKTLLISQSRASPTSLWLCNSRWCSYTGIFSSQSCWQLVWLKYIRARLFTQRPKLTINLSTHFPCRQTTLAQSESTATSHKSYLRAIKQQERSTSWCLAL
jgi:hypothetical protein